MRIAIVGPGKMGRAVAEVAVERGHSVRAELGAGEITRGALDGAEVAIEFTTPGAAPANLMRLAELGIPTVCGTTGWYSALTEIAAAFEEAGVGLVHAPNFSVGAQLMMQIARETASRLADLPEFDAWIVETHHTEKRDAPSGTAARLRETLRGSDPMRDYPVTSIRGGHVPGTHELHMDTGGEALLLRHTARDRTIFAHGAVVAAERLISDPHKGAIDFGTSLFGNRR